MFHRTLRVSGFSFPTRKTEAQCGLSPEQRFTFYDHVHTTGRQKGEKIEKDEKIRGIICGYTKDYTTQGLWGF